MARRLHFSSWLVPLALVVLLAAAEGQAWAQTLNEGWQKLQDEERKVHSRIVNFRKGVEKADPNDQAHVEAIDVLAKTWTYGVYLQKLENQPTKIDGDFGMFVRDVESILKAKNPQMMQPFGEVFRDKIRIHALEVLEFDQARAIHKIHNARVLEKVAELGQPELADTLIKILKDPKQNDGVRYYVLRGLGTLLAQVQPADMTSVLSKQQQANCAEALVGFLEQRKGPSKNAPPEEIDGFRWLRREAIRVLAKIHTPAVNDKVRPALVLARLAGNDESIQPPLRIDERVEAAIGLAHMKSTQDKQYQPDYAAGQIAKCLGAFAQMTEDERTGRTKKKDAPSTRPWRIDAVMLKDALAALKTDSGKNAYVSQMTARGTRLLDSIIAVKAIDPNELTWWNTAQSDPPSKELFQGSADSVVKPAPLAEAAPEK
ncbi:MAG TPA: hypothetical protein VMG10_28550 [Gemmataceae bacterium]|nr:hypothetical protein [Gemmataceae bacterium]